MELLKLDERSEEFEYKGVTFFVKKNFTPEDKFFIDTSGELGKDGRIKFHPREYYRALIQVFVVGWKGVTENGKEVPYSFETLCTRLPADMTDGLFLKLSLFIGKLHGFTKSDEELKKEAELKNESGAQSNG